MAGRPRTRASRAAQERLDELKAANRASIEASRRTEPETFHLALIPELLTLSRMGYTFAEVADHWSVAEETLEGWGEAPPLATEDEKDAHLVFAEALRRARTGAKACWQRWLRLAMEDENNKFPAGAWMQAMGAMFPGYDTKQTIGITFDITRSLVILDLRSAEPLGEQTVGEAKPLIEHGPARLVGSQTGESGLAIDLTSPSDGLASSSSRERSGPGE